MIQSVFDQEQPTPRRNQRPIKTWVEFWGFGRVEWGVVMAQSRRPPAHTWPSNHPIKPLINNWYVYGLIEVP